MKKLNDKSADDFAFCDWCEKVLYYVSIIGVVLSMLGLLITIIYDICLTFHPALKEAKSTRSEFMKNHLKTTNQFLKLLTTWCLILLILNVVYIVFATYDLASIKTNLTVKNSCIAIGVLLHYFLICAFCFSLTITSIQYVMVNKTFKIIKFIYLKSTIFSFGN